MNKRQQQQVKKLVRQTTTQVRSAQRTVKHQTRQQAQQADREARLRQLAARDPEPKMPLSPAAQQAIAREMLRALARN